MDSVIEHDTSVMAEAYKVGVETIHTLCRRRRQQIVDRRVIYDLSAWSSLTGLMMKRKRKRKRKMFKWFEGYSFTENTLFK